jgi:hypothetical protein
MRTNKTSSSTQAASSAQQAKVSKGASSKRPSVERAAFPVSKRIKVSIKQSDETFKHPSNLLSNKLADILLGISIIEPSSIEEATSKSIKEEAATKQQTSEQ